MVDACRSTSTRSCRKISLEQHHDAEWGLYLHPVLLKHGEDWNFRWSMLCQSYMSPPPQIFFPSACKRKAALDLTDFSPQGCILLPRHLALPGFPDRKQDECSRMSLEPLQCLISIGLSRHTISL
eukprot:scaffold63490_cov18-Tisochrysis_lutea.AAC.1